jgi:predicted NBD/HSP70 family sugar kinase
MDRARRAFATACVGFVNAFNPHRIIVGGAIAQAQGDRMLDVARQTIAREGFRRTAAAVEIVQPELGPDVSLAGAYPLVLARLGDPAWQRGRSARGVPLSAPATDQSVQTPGVGRA